MVTMPHRARHGAYRLLAGVGSVLAICRIANIWAVTSTVSGGGDNGADPDKLVAIEDPVDATTPAPLQRFRTVRTANFGQVLRGVSLTPGTGSDN